MATVVTPLSCNKKAQSGFSNNQRTLSTGKLDLAQADCSLREALNLHLNHGFFCLGDCMHNRCLHFCCCDVWPGDA